MTNTVSVRTTLNFKRFQVPNFANVAGAARPRQEGMQPLESIAIADLAPDTLDALAAAWLEDIYAKANRDCPFERKDDQ